MEIQYKKGIDGSYLHNCVIKSRKNEKVEVLFYQDKSISAFLNGYAIIPIKKYYKLIGKECNKQLLKDIKEADNQLHN